ncbi:MAG: hypothetical protein NVS3B12_19400 [Acidimicrobiales bacterium]
MSAESLGPAGAVADLLATAGVEERVILRGRFGFLAFHAGVEGGTDVVASKAAEASGASLYCLVQPPSVRWHLPSHVIGAEASLRLVAFLDHVDIAVAIHGYGRPERPRDLLLGGRNRPLALELGRALRRKLPDWPVVDDLHAIPREMRGLHPDNPVNLVRGAGVQLELPPAVRGASGRWVDPNIGCVPEPGLVEALAQVASSYRTPEPPEGFFS